MLLSVKDLHFVAISMILIQVLWVHNDSVNTNSTSPGAIRGHTEDIISYFTLMSSEIHYYDIIEKMGSWTLMSSEV